MGLAHYSHNEHEQTNRRAVFKGILVSIREPAAPIRNQGLFALVGLLQIFFRTAETPELLLSTQQERECSKPLLLLLEEAMHHLGF